MNLKKIVNMIFGIEDLPKVYLAKEYLPNEPTKLDYKMFGYFLKRRAWSEIDDFNENVNDITNTLDDVRKNSRNLRKFINLYFFIETAKIEINETEKELSFTFITENRTEEYSIHQLKDIKEDYNQLCLYDDRDKSLEYFISEKVFEYLLLKTTPYNN